MEGRTAGCELVGMNNNRELQDKVERLVRELVDAHIEETRAAVAAAVARALGASAMAMPANAVKKKQQQQPQPRNAGRRRPPEEVAALAERLYAQVCAKPGEPMLAFATELGATPRELHRPMMTLKRAGRVRSVGERHRTRYFPAVASEANLRSA